MAWTAAQQKALLFCLKQLLRVKEVPRGCQTASRHAFREIAVYVVRLMSQADIDCCASHVLPEWLTDARLLSACEEAHNPVGFVKVADRSICSSVPLTAGELRLKIKNAYITANQDKLYQSAVIDAGKEDLHYEKRIVLMKRHQHQLLCFFFHNSVCARWVQLLAMLCCAHLSCVISLPIDRQGCEKFRVLQDTHPDYVHANKKWLAQTRASKEQPLEVVLHAVIMYFLMIPV